MTEVCFNYVSEGCEGGVINYRFARSTRSAQEANATRDILNAEEGENCFDLYFQGPGLYRLEVWVDCGGERTNVLTQEISVECDLD